MGRKREYLPIGCKAKLSIINADGGPAIDAEGSAMFIDCVVLVVDDSGKEEEEPMYTVSTERGPYFRVKESRLVWPASCEIHDSLTQKGRT